MGGQRRRGNLRIWSITATFDLGPVVVAPMDALQRCLAAKRAMQRRVACGGIVLIQPGATPFERSTTQMGQHPFASLGLHETGMAGALQAVGALLPGRQQGVAGQSFVRSVDAARASQCHRMLIEGAALGGHQVVPTVAAVEVWTLDDLQLGTCVDILHRAGQATALNVVLLHQDAVEVVLAGHMNPLLVEQPVAPVVVVEHAGVKARAVQEGALAPGTINAGRGDQVVVRILVRSVHAAHVGVDHPEQTIRIAQTRRPDAGRIGMAGQVQLTLARDRIGTVLPMHQVLAMVDAHRWPPFKG